MPRFSLYSALRISRKFDPPHKYVTSPFIRSPLLFAAARIIISSYILFTLLFTLIWRSVIMKDARSYFSYFTNLTYVGLCAYYWAAAVQTASYALKWRRSGAGVGYPLQRWPRFLQALHILLQSSVTTFPLLVTIVYWSLLAGASSFATRYSTWSNISIHAMNSGFALIEILFSNSPPAPWCTLPFNILILAGYLGIAYITRATQGFYAYTFLDPRKQHAKLAAYIIGIPIGEVIIFALVRGIVVLRERWAVKAGRVLKVEQEGHDGWQGVDASSRGPSNDDDWEEIQRPSGVGLNSKGFHEP